MEKNITITIKDFWFGTTMAGRNTGNKIREKMKPYFNMSIPVILDFINIENATHSFIDEVIGTFAEENFEKTISKIRIINANDDIKSSIRFVLAERKSNQNA